MPCSSRLPSSGSRRRQTAATRPRCPRREACGRGRPGFRSRRRGSGRSSRAPAPGRRLRHGPNGRPRRAQPLTPERTICRIASSAAISHATSTGSMFMPPRNANGSGAIRVQRTNPSLAGSPDATPSENGLALNCARAGMMPGTPRRRKAGGETALEQGPAVDAATDRLPSAAHQVQAASNCSRFAQSSVLSSARVELVEQLVDLGRLDDQRRADRDHVARDEAHDQAFGLGVAHHRARRRRASDRTAVLASLVGGKLDRADQAHAARLADQRMIAERHQALLELRRACRRGLEDLVALVDLQRLQRDRGRDRMARIGEAVAEGADLAALGDQRLVHVLRDHHAGDRQIGRRQRLGDRDRVRLVAERRAAEHRAEPAEAADHLVVDHEHVVLGAHRHDLREIGLRRHDHAARAHHRLGDEGRDRVRAFAQDQLFELGGAAASRNPPRSRRPCRSDSGAGSVVCSTRAIGRSKSMWLFGRPVSEADAMVTP